MKKKLLVIGGVAAGPKAAAKARRCDPEMEIVVYQEEDVHYTSERKEHASGHLC